MANQFDPFSAPSPAQTSPNSNPFDAFATDTWQNSARAITSSSAWKNATKSLSKSSSSSSLVAPKRIIPYEGPIATLQSQWDPHLYAAASVVPPNPNSLWRDGNFYTYLIVEGNESCILSGGVEGVLKWSKAQQRQGEMDFVDPCLGSLSLNDDVEEERTSNGASSNFDSFVNSSRTKSGGLNFLKSGLKKAQASIERSVTTIAIRADGGKNRDWMCASLHFLMSQNSPGNNGVMAAALGMSTPLGRGEGLQEEVCLSRTEWVQMPSGEGVVFNIPLCVPDLGFVEAAGDDGVRLTIRMYIRSGAALLNIVKREYCIGEVTMLYSNVFGMARRSQGQPQGSGVYSSSINLPITSGMLAEVAAAPAALKITATQRVKFSQPCTHGWSLTDPISTAPGPNSWLKMFQLPLDQAYAFPILNHHELLNAHRLTYQCTASSAVLIANERAVESTLTLPIATAVAQLLAEASRQSSQIASVAANRAVKRESIRCYPIPDNDEARANAMADAAVKEGCAYVDIGVVALILESGAVGPPVSGMMTFQRCDSIFEETLVSGFSCPILDKASGETVMNAPTHREAVTKRFCPKVYSGVLDIDGGDALLPGVVGTSSTGYVGSVRLSVSVAAAGADTTYGLASGVTTFEGVVPLEPYLSPNTQKPNKVPVVAPAIDANTGKVIGKFLFLLRVKSQLIHSQPTEPAPNAASGLVSTIGLDTLTEDFGMSYQLDNCATAENATTSVRQRQVATMGAFLSSNYLKYHAEERTKDTTILTDRFEKYIQSIKSGISSEVTMDDEANVPLFRRHTPRAFRSSHSRPDQLLAGIGFNVHVQALTLNLLQDGLEAIPAVVCSSVTHGAPADHARGFGVVGNDDNESGIVARGGLRRLESARHEYVKQVDDNIQGLINAIGEYFNMRANVMAARQQAGIKNSRHIPPNIQACNYYRNGIMESMVKLHSLTWKVAVRRGNCFSQALGIAVTSYLSSLSDGGPAWRFANVWAQHGYLISFEGLLSAVGKELGMIEDASTAVEMLRMVNVVLVPANNGATGGIERQRIPVPHSPFVRTVCLTPSGSGSETTYRLEIELDPAYYEKRVPAPLKGTVVRFVPVLFQMGVDIRQWGANAGRNVTTQIKDRTKAGGAIADGDCCADFDATSEPKNQTLIDDGDDDDDEVGPAEVEILVALNVEGYRKLNAYAHTINPVSGTAQPLTNPTSDQLQTLPPHPMLSVLNDTIKASAGKMEHGVLDHAATVCQRLGGGSTVFCKSGKDRTAMQVTFKQAQSLQRFIGKKDVNTPFEDVPVSFDDVFVNSTLMRIHGTRVPICEKNAGESKYAFNPLQAKFMPDALKPPPIALAGFLKKPET